MRIAQGSMPLTLGLVFLIAISCAPPRAEVDPTLIRVADRTVRMDLPRWSWDTGVAIYGLMRAWERTGDKRYFDFVRDWVDGYIERGIAVQHVNHVAPGLATLMLYEETRERRYLDVAYQLGDYVLNQAPRTADGGLIHRDDQLWVDTLFMVAPFMARLGKVTGDELYYDEAIYQIIVHAKHLQDPSTGLFYHAWDQSEDSNMSAAFWGRGNGWAAMACAEVLELLPEDHPQRRQVLDISTRQIEGLVNLQDASGMWHTVVDRPEFYLETSATMAISYAIHKAIRHKWIGPRYSAAADRALEAVKARVAADGSVEGVSAGTDVQPSIEDYNAIPHEGIRAWGQGFYLLLLAEF